MVDKYLDVLIAFRTFGDVDMSLRIAFVCLGLALFACGDAEVDDADGDSYPADVDCNDADAAINPGAAEVCDEQDNNCNGTIDEGAIDAIDAYQDADGDGFGVSSTMEQVCGERGWSALIQIVMTSLRMLSGAAEACDDGVVNDCDVVFCDEEARLVHYSG